MCPVYEKAWDGYLVLKNAETGDKRISINHNLVSPLSVNRKYKSISYGVSVPSQNLDSCGY